MNTLYLYPLLSFILGLLISTFFSRKKYERLLAEKAALEGSQKHLLQQLEDKQENMRLEIKMMTERFVHKSSQELQDQSTKNVSALLSPLKEKLQDFEKKIQDTYQAEARERFALKKEIERIVSVNEEMKTETKNLTRALKGDSKTQGNWGEIILERLLEAAGLRQGSEFTVQGKNLNLRDQSGKSLRPDVIIHLPDKKHIIVDSKVSLVSYERYCNEESEELKKKHLKDFRLSVRNHIDQLASKHYQKIDTIRSPDFVFLFLALESAFLMANQLDSQLFSYAWDKKIIIVGPSTLLPSLRTVSSLWKSERQNRNSLEIAQQGARLYDKFVGFVDSMNKIGKGLDDAQKQYTEAMGRLKEGKGNLMRQAEKLQELGVRSEKKLLD